MEGQKWTSLGPVQNMASDFNTPQSHAINEISSVFVNIAKLCLGALSHVSVNCYYGCDDDWWFQSALSTGFID